jgi:hypothetical protein
VLSPLVSPDISRCHSPVVAGAAGVRLLAAVTTLVSRDVRRLSGSILAPATPERLLTAMNPLVRRDGRCTSSSILAPPTPERLLAAVSPLVPRDVRRLSSSILAPPTSERLLAPVSPLVPRDMRHRCRSILAPLTSERLLAPVNPLVLRDARRVSSSIVAPPTPERLLSSVSPLVPCNMTTIVGSILAIPTPETRHRHRRCVITSNASHTIVTSACTHTRASRSTHTRVTASHAQHTIAQHTHQRRDSASLRAASQQGKSRNKLATDDGDSIALCSTANSRDYGGQSLVVCGGCCLNHMTPVFFRAHFCLWDRAVVRCCARLPCLPLVVAAVAMLTPLRMRFSAAGSPVALPLILLLRGPCTWRRDGRRAVRQGACGVGRSVGCNVCVAGRCSRATPPCLAGASALADHRVILYLRRSSSPAVAASVGGRCVRCSP